MDYQEIVQKLIEKIQGLNEREFREQRLYSTLSRLENDEIAEVLDLIYVGAIRNNPFCQSMIESMGDLSGLKKRLAPGRLAEAYAHAEETELIFAAEFMSPLDLNQKKIQWSEVHMDLANLTVGERRSLAKTCDQNTLEKIMVDPQPLVVASMLNHPKLTELQVVQMAARKPIGEEILVTIYENKKWFARYKVKLALVQNPYSPGWMVMLVLPFLEKPDLKRLKMSPRFTPGFVDHFLDALRGDYPPSDQEKIDQLFDDGPTIH